MGYISKKVAAYGQFVLVKIGNCVFYGDRQNQRYCKKKLGIG